MSPKVPFLRWDDPFRALEMLASLWSSTGLPTVGAHAVAMPYRTLFATLQQLLVGKEVTVRIGDQDVTLTVVELESELDPQGLPVGQLGEVRVAARDIRWADNRLQSAVAVLRNVHIRPGVPPLVIAAPTELTTELPKDLFDHVMEQAAPHVRSESGEDGTARLSWARRGGCSATVGQAVWAVWAAPVGPAATVASSSVTVDRVGPVVLATQQSTTASAVGVVPGATPH